MQYKYQLFSNPHIFSLKGIPISLFKIILQHEDQNSIENKKRRKNYEICNGEKNVFCCDWRIIIK